MAEKLTAVIDKSLFHEICELSHSEKSDAWRLLLDKYQIIVPFVLLEEILVNAINPGVKSRQSIEAMVADITQLRHCWMDDILEYAFCELVRKQPIEKFIAPPDEFQQRILTLKFDDPLVVRWAEERKADRKVTAQRWKRVQQAIAPKSGFHVVKSEREFFDRVVRPEFVRILKDPSQKLEYLETVLGERFRIRHPESIKEIDTAFADYNEHNFGSFQTTLACLVLRLAYILAPAVRIQRSPGLATEIILNPKTYNQLNNATDEQYVICAQLCARLLTMDQGMRNIAEIFRGVGLWKGQTIFFDSQKPIALQMPFVLV
jgi:hypothetical protein